MEINIDKCEECKMLLNWTNQLNIEKENEKSYYIRIFGYIEIERKCNKCEKIVERLKIKRKDGNFYYVELYETNLSLKNKKDFPMKEDKWYYYLIKKEEIAILTEKLRGNLNEIMFIRYKENKKYETYQIFGYNSEKLYIKQTIGIQKNVN
jgi:hypothetical protein